ncbi:MAG: tetratricopeptide repeat protein [Planctomycetia bacterium]|nr:tetratricopeptide repeat protein [Planctomycetia bacterium]
MECVREKNSRSRKKERFVGKTGPFLRVGGFFLILVVGNVILNAQEFRRNRSREVFLPPSRSVTETVSTYPRYIPDVSEAYFFGSSEVYPDPYTPPQVFIPAEGVSRPVPDEVLRADRRKERFAKVQRLRGRSGTASVASEREVESVPFSVVFPEQESRFSMEETLPPEFLHQDGTTRPLPHPDEKKLELAPPQVLESLENIPDLPEITPPQNQHSGLLPLSPAWRQDTAIVPAAYYTDVASQNVTYPNRSQEKLPYPVQKKAAPPSQAPLPVPIQSRVRPGMEFRAENHLPVPVSAQPLRVEGVSNAVEEESIPHYQAQRGLEEPPLTAVRLPSQELFHPHLPRRIFTENERSALPWFARYIRDMDAEEYSLLRNALSHLPMQMSLIRASIVASHPANAERANELLRQYYRLQQQALATFAPHDTELKKAEKLLQFIHEEILTGGYQLELTTMENLFQGRYNCVTATILYCSLGRQAGLKVTPVELPGHAMCWVYGQDGSKMDVETTCKEWFQYLDKPDVRNQVIEDLILQANPTSAMQETSRQNLFRQIHPISDEKLLAKIYYNRGVDLLAEKDFAGALEANAIALLLDSSSETTRGNLLATMNNWAIALCQEGYYSQAAELLRDGLQYEPEYAMFRNNHVHVFHRWVESLYRSGQYSEALQITERGLQEQPHQPHLQRLYEQIRTVATPQTPVLQ